MVVREWGEFVYAPPSTKRDRRIILPTEEAHHLFRVRRVPIGSEVFASDGDGMVYRCYANSAEELEIIEPLPNHGEPRFSVTLCIAALKGDANRDVVDQATQLGVSSIIFFHGARSIGRLIEEKIDRLNRTAVAALKQTGRARLPKIVLARNIKEMLQGIASCPHRLIAHLDDAESAARNSEWSPIAGDCALLVGPEGGFSEDEIRFAIGAGCKPLTLSNRRLRSEVAVAAGLSFLLDRIGESYWD